MQPGIPSVDEYSAVLAYSSLLSQVLEDRFVDEEEGQALVDLATRWAIPAERVQTIHRDFLPGLEIEALADGVVTGAERRDLHRVAVLLGLDSANIDQILAMASEKLGEVQTQAQASAWALDCKEFIGKQVCFTGECQCRFEGESITRSMAAELAMRRGMIVSDSVTKKLDLLVVSDPLSQSGKAKKARRFGIRIVYESVFWKALGLEVG